MWLEVLTGEDAGRVVEVPEGRPFVLGRVQGADLVVRDARASRMHVELTAAGDAAALHDLDSANGTLVDGERVATATLRDGGERIADRRTSPSRSSPGARGDGRADRRGGAAGGGPGAGPVVVDGRAARRAPHAPRAAAHLRRRGGGRRGRRRDSRSCSSPAGASDERSRRDRSGDVAPATCASRRPAAARAAAPAPAGWTATGSWSRPRTWSTVGTEVTVDGRPAPIMAVAPCEDLALLQVPTTGAPLDLAQAGGWEQGETVLAFGYPESRAEGEPPSSTRGVVSAARTQFRDPAPDVPALRRRDPDGHRARPRLLRRPARRPRRTVIGVNAAARTHGRRRAPAPGRQLRDPRRPHGGGARAAAPRPLDRLDRRELRLPDGRAARRAHPAAGALRPRRRARQRRGRAGLGDGGDLLVAVNGRPVDGTLMRLVQRDAGIRSGQTAKLGWSGRMGDEDRGGAVWLSGAAGPEAGAGRRGGAGRLRSRTLIGRCPSSSAAARGARRPRTLYRPAPADVAVIGGGIVGCGIAAFLAEGARP